MFKKLATSLALGAALLTGAVMPAEAGSDCYHTKGEWKVCYRDIGYQDYIVSVKRPGVYWEEVFNIQCNYGAYVSSSYYSSMNSEQQYRFVRSFCRTAE